MYDVNKYKYYTTKNQVIAVSTYAGKIVRGVAKCNPMDEFDLAKGKKLAAARLTYKVSQKRIKNAQRLLKEASEKYEIAERRYNNMKDYLQDACAECAEAYDYLRDVEKSL